MSTRLSAVPAPGRAGTAAPTTSRGDRGMDVEPTKSPWQVEVNDVILRHPDRPEVTGEWRVTGEPKLAGGWTTIPYSTPDGGEGVFALEPAQRVTCRPATTYRVHALLTHDERAAALLAMTPRERTFLAAETAHRYGEIFDAVHAQLLKARAADAACLRDEVAS